MVQDWDLMVFRGVGDVHMSLNLLLVFWWWMMESQFQICWFIWCKQVDGWPEGLADSSVISMALVHNRYRLRTEKKRCKILIFFHIFHIFKQVPDVCVWHFRRLLMPFQFLSTHYFCLRKEKRSIKGRPLLTYERFQKNRTIRNLFCCDTIKYSINIT